MYLATVSALTSSAPSAAFGVPVAQAPAAEGATGRGLMDGIGEDGILGWFERLWFAALDIWLDGGWAMIAIAVIALTMFGVGIGIWLRLRSKGFGRVPERVWRRWIQNPNERHGPVGEMLDYVTGGKSLDDTVAFFRQLRTNEAAPFERDLKLMKVCVSAAPLVGLLGTVTGMLATFNAMAVGGGGDKTMGMIAKGISEALVTTETGLVVALPGVFFQYQLSRGFQAYRAFMTHLETVCIQVLHRGAEAERRRLVREAAEMEAAAVLRERLRERLAAGAFPAGQSQ